jgi:hypothetical protein
MLPSSIYILFQAIAALLIFVIGYLALLVSVLACFAIAVVVYRCARLLWAQPTKCSVPVGRLLSTEARGDARLVPCQLAILNHPIATARRFIP